MADYDVECNECDETFTAGSEDAAVGWMFGHAIRTGHDEIEKYEK